MLNLKRGGEQPLSSFFTEKIKDCTISINKFALLTHLWCDMSTREKLYKAAEKAVEQMKDYREYETVLSVRRDGYAMLGDIPGRLRVPITKDDNTDDVFARLCRKCKTVQ